LSFLGGLVFLENDQAAVPVPIADVRLAQLAGPGTAQPEAAEQQSELPLASPQGLAEHAGLFEFGRDSLPFAAGRFGTVVEDFFLDDALIEHKFLQLLPGRYRLADRVVRLR